MLPGSPVLAMWGPRKLIGGRSRPVDRLLKNKRAPLAKEPVLTCEAVRFSRVCGVNDEASSDIRKCQQPG
eukprot:gene7100-8255_t